jgi:Holliday junction resolvase RusA-like endonuclease
MIDEARTHWAISSKTKKMYTETAALQAKRYQKITSPVFITFHWYYSSGHDFDNMRAGAKYLLDGLVVAGVLANDNQKHVLGFGGDYFIKVERGNEKVILELEEVIT